MNIRVLSNSLLTLILLSAPVNAEMVKMQMPDGSIQLVKTRHIRTQDHTKMQFVTREDIKRMVRISSYKHKVDERLVMSIIQAESAFKPAAVSSKGAIGLMQIMKPTGQWLHVKDLTDYRQNIDGGVRYLKFLLALFKNDTALAVAAYNAGQNAVISRGNKIPNYPETQKYVQTVLTYYRK